MGPCARVSRLPFALGIVSLLLAAGLSLASARGAVAQTAPTGEATMAWHVTIAPTLVRSVHRAAADHAVRHPLRAPRRAGAPAARAEDGHEPGRVVDGEPRRARSTSSSCAAALKFHNGDPVTAEDVKFSFERYKGAGAKELQARVRQVEVVDPLTIRFHLKEPWPDFMTFYGTTATAAGLVVPKKYVDPGRRRGLPQASDRRRPLQVREPHAGRGGGAGGQHGVLAARAQRQAAGHEERARGDHAGGHAEERARPTSPSRSTARMPRTCRRDPRLQLVPSKHASIYWIEFAEQWDPKSPWHDKRLRQAVNHALDRKAINEAACLGFCPPTGVIVPRVMDFALQTPGRCPTTRRRPSSSSPRPATPTASTPASSCRSRRSSRRGGGGGELPERGRHPRADAPDGARGLLRGLAGEEAARAVHGRGGQLGQRGQPRRRRSSTPRAATPTAAIPTSTTSSCSRRASGIRASARPCCTASSSSPSTGRCSRRSWTTARCAASGPGWPSTCSTRCHLVPYPAWEDMRMKPQ